MFLFTLGGIITSEYTNKPNTRKMKEQSNLENGLNCIIGINKWIVHDIETTPCFVVTFQAYEALQR